MADDIRKIINALEERGYDAGAEILDTVVDQLFRDSLIPQNIDTDNEDTSELDESVYDIVRELCNPEYNSATEIDIETKEEILKTIEKMNSGSLLKAARLSMKKSLSDIADSTGFSVSYTSLIENSKREIPIRKIERLFSAYEIYPQSKMRRILLDKIGKIIIYRQMK